MGDYQTKTYSTPSKRSRCILEEYQSPFTTIMNQESFRTEIRRIYRGGFLQQSEVQRPSRNTRTGRKIYCVMLVTKPVVGLAESTD